MTGSQYAGMDGLEVVQRLRKRGRTLPVLLLRREARWRIKGLNVGADDYLPKPFELEGSWMLVCGPFFPTRRGRVHEVRQLGELSFMMKGIFCYRDGR